LLLRRAHDRAGNGVVGAALRQRCGGQQIIGGNTSGGQHGVYFKHAFGEGAGFVQRCHADIAQVIEHRAALDKDAPARSRANAAKVAQRNGNKQGAGAGNDQQHQSAVNPLREGAKPEQRGQHRHQKSNARYCGGVPAGHTSDEALRRGLAGHGVFHHFKNTGYGRIGKSRCHFNPQGRVKIDGASKYTTAGSYALGH